MAEEDGPVGSEGEPASNDAGVSAVAVALGASRSGAKLPPEAAALLKEQTELVRLQKENLAEDRALQHRHLALRYFGDRLRIGLQLLAIVIGIVLVAGLGALIWQASQDRGLVIEAFSVPPSLAQDGLTGDVVAARFLDKLQGLQAATQSVRPAASYQNNWGADLKVEIPQTGVTLGEFERLLRDRLGHASHVTGEVTKTSTGIALTARMAGETPATFFGGEGDLDTLAQKAAEDIYRHSQPYRYAEYLSQHGRLQEATAVASDLGANGPRGERAWAFALLSRLDLERGDLGAARTDIDQGLAAGGEGVEWVNINRVTAELWSGHDQALLDGSRYIDQHEAQRRSSQITEAAFQENRLISSGYLAGQVGDYPRSAADYATLAQSEHALWRSSFYIAQVADALARNHDVSAATTILSRTPPDDVSFYVTEASEGWYALPAYQLAVARGDWPAALAAVRAVAALIEAQKAAHPVLDLMEPVLVRPLTARALARTGEIAGAEALAATTRLDCYLCLRVRGEIAAAKKDWPAAERWFAQATRRAPSIPFAFTEWGRMRLARGDLAGAATVFEIAHRNGPHFADPLKGWGDVLARQGRLSEALAKYDEALKLAPAWTELRKARDVVVVQSHGRQTS